MPHLAPSAAPQITARDPRSGHAAPRAQRFGALFWRARDGHPYFWLQPRGLHSRQIYF